MILQSGESFDPTKAGYSAISVDGVSGRTTRILLDGQDITDETVGTTIFNVSQGAVGEFQLNRSNSDVSGDVTSTGLVLVSTNSGTNSLHGQVFYNFQDHRAGYALTKNGVDVPFQRNQFGLSVGGPIIKDKLFFFGNSERIKQDSAAASSVLTGSSALFSQVAAAYPSVTNPYRETYSTIRLDYNGPFGGHYFVRGNYNVNSVASNGGDGYWLYSNRDNTPGIAGGADFATGALRTRSACRMKSSTIGSRTQRQAALRCITRSRICVLQLGTGTVCRSELPRAAGHLPVGQAVPV